jgi:hypothetical protein
MILNTTNGRSRHNWRRVTQGHPCPICKAQSWCSVTADGTLAKCMKVEADSFKTGEQKDGARCYLHRLAGVAHSEPPPRSFGPQTPRADADQLHRAYSAMLALLQLSLAHRKALGGRGLSDEEIDRRGYRTLSRQGRSRLARDLREQMGDALLSVPGFIVKPGDDGSPYFTITGAAGLLVPVRDMAGRIVALLVRRDDAKNCGRKYSYLSSEKYGGPGSGATPHVPLGVEAPAGTVRLTEGPLKADVAAALSSLATVGAAGLAVELERWDKAAGKGIDDLLASGKVPEILAGDAARAAVAEALAAATAGEPPPTPDKLDRLASLLADGGAEAFFRDSELLRALARLAETDPAEFACRRAQVQPAGVKLRDLDRALAPQRQEIRRERPSLDAAGCYRVSAGRIVRDVPTKDGPVEVPLTNWSGCIVEQTVHDDGAERRRTLAVEGALTDGTLLPRANVPADQFAWMRWPVEMWGTQAVVLAGASTADHVRVALQLLSRDVPTRTVYGHTDWRKIGDAWHYLHAGGAIGKNGLAVGVEVSLPDPLAGFVLPEPPEEESLAAVLASLALLNGLTADRLAFPLLASVYRAVLGEAPGPIDLFLELAGPHGVGKSELAALADQHFGAALDARHLPGS